MITPEEVDRHNRVAYNQIATEFTDDLRVTTSNFHALSKSFFQHAIQRCVVDDVSVLELGPGTGFLTAMLEKAFNDIIALDISENMLSSLPLSDRVRPQLGSAFCIDLPAGTIDYVFCSLTDSFMRIESVNEVYRLLKKNGLFIFTSPSRIWSDAIRHEVHKTEFQTRRGETITAFSFTYFDEEMIDLVNSAGFVIVAFDVATGSGLSGPIVSPAIRAAAARLEKPVNELPILQMVIAQRLA